MRELRETILRQGQCVGDSIVKVDMFLNHRLDTRLMFAMGRELADYFGKDKPDRAHSGSQRHRPGAGRGAFSG